MNKELIPVDDLNYLDIAKEFAKENEVPLETAILLIMAEEINLLRREINELKNGLNK